MLFKLLNWDKYNISNEFTETWLLGFHAQVQAQPGGWLRHQWSSEVSSGLLLALKRALEHAPPLFRPSNMYEQGGATVTAISIDTNQNQNRILSWDQKLTAKCHTASQPPSYLHREAGCRYSLEIHIELPGFALELVNGLLWMLRTAGTFSLLLFLELCFFTHLCSSCKYQCDRLVLPGL